MFDVTLMSYDLIGGNLYFPRNVGSESGAFVTWLAWMSLIPGVVQFDFKWYSWGAFLAQVSEMLDGIKLRKQE